MRNDVTDEKGNREQGTGNRNSGCRTGNDTRKELTMIDTRVDDYKDLIAWKRAMELTKTAYLLARLLPREENYALADQIRRSSVSIPSNIAEGYGRTSPKEYALFLSVARGSSYELETQIILCVDLGYIQEADTVKAIGLCKEVARILTRILQSLGNKQAIKAR